MSVIRDQDLMEPLFQSLAESDNISVIGGFTQGTRNLYTTDAPVKRPAYLAGKKIRVQESAMHIRMIELMGGSATPLTYGEVYTAMQSGVLDGAENNEISYVTQNHFEVARYNSNTNHLVGLDYMVMRHDLLDAMSEPDREMFLEEWDAAMTEHTDLWNTETDAVIEKAKAGGAEFVEVDSQAFTDALAPIKDEFLTSEFQRELYEAVRAADTSGGAAS
ncbi:TRAP transporter substrate-binding protein DctP [Corynebacterium glutamicum]|uniref:TRAP transporter substrate-binding protein DctP n=1 Tax=Corynebacterium glutamicum TaxID=1718 RepID=UPI001F52ABBB|nr:TRAP transporter substrate-binding protein DctP [Corynebacterium glutamicum]